MSKLSIKTRERLIDNWRYVSPAYIQDITKLETLSEELGTTIANHAEADKNQQEDYDKIRKNLLID